MNAGMLRTVLYVDDDPDICEVVQTTLCVVAGLEVRVAHSGAQALELATETRPDLIVMDVMMPGLDGPSTLKEMRRRTPLADIPVAFLTAKVLPAEVARFLAMGAIGVLEKPFDPGRLCDELLALWDGDTTPRNLVGRSKSSEWPLPDNGLSASFLERSAGDVARLRSLVGRLSGGDGSLLKDIERAAHTLHGAAAMFGFAEVSELGGLLERLAEECHANPGTAGAAEETAAADALRSLVERLSGAVDRAGSIGPSGAPLFQDRGGGR